MLRQRLLFLAGLIAIVPTPRVHAEDWGLCHAPSYYFSINEEIAANEAVVEAQSVLRSGEHRLDLTDQVRLRQRTANIYADEATLFYPSMNIPTVLAPEFPEALDDRLTLLRELYGDADAEALIDLYGLDDPETYQKAEMDMLGDDLFGVHMRFLAQANTQSGMPSYLYHFTRVPPSKSQTIGAFHAAEIFFVFGSHSPLAGLTEEDETLTAAMGKYWTNFAKTGNPNGADLPDWPVYDAASDEWMTFNPSIEVKTGVRADKLDIMERQLLSRIQAAVPQITPQVDEPVLALGGEEASTDSLQP